MSSKSLSLLNYLFKKRCFRKLQVPLLFTSRNMQTEHFNLKKNPQKSFKHIEMNSLNEDDSQTLSEEQIRSILNQRGLLKKKNVARLSLKCTGETCDPYVPIEGDGKMTTIVDDEEIRETNVIRQKVNNLKALQIIYTLDKDFDPVEFYKISEEIYIKGHKTLETRDADKLLVYFTERALPDVLENVDCRTIKWKFLKHLEPPKLVHARCTALITKGNVFAQLSVRFHSQQSLSIYDRFGRLLHGSEIVAKDVLEYVVFEKHISSSSGVWRIHDKIIPE